MRLLFLCSGLALFGAVATFACSSASPATTTTDAGTPGTGSSSSSSGDDGTSSSSSSSSSSGSTTDPDAGNLDAGTSSSGGLVLGGDGGASCDSDAFAEAEPNDTAGAPNTLVLNAIANGVSSTKYCGTVSPTDTDFVTFNMPSFTRSYSVAVPKATGNVHILGTIGGQNFDINNNDFPNGVQAGDPWVVQIKPGNGGGSTTRSYEVVFNFCDQSADCNNL